MTNSRWISYTGHTVIDNPNLNVYDAALARIRHLFTLSPNYVVSFSGGKDSTTAIPKPEAVPAQTLKKIVFFVTDEEEAVISRAVGTRLAEGVVALCRAKLGAEAVNA